MLEEVRRANRPLILAGDGRHSTVGKSAMYCTYSTQDCVTKKILNVEQVYVSKIMQYSNTITITESVYYGY